MTVLALDTSHPTASATLRLEDGRGETIVFGAAKSQLVELGVSVSSLIERAGRRVEDIDRVAVVSGPGSFTGLRIGMAYAKGLHAATGATLVAMSSLELLATEALISSATAGPMIDARRNEVYAALFERGEACGAIDGRMVYRAVCERPAAATDPRTFLLSLKKRSVVLVGSGAARYRSVIEEILGMNGRIKNEPVQPSTRLLAGLAGELDADDVNLLEPNYVRPSDAKLQPLRKVQTHE